MQEVLRFIETKKQRLAAHPFYEWVRKADTPLETRLRFAPIMANFVMNFRDMNLWFIRFQKGRERLRAIGGAVVDAHDSRRRP